MDKTEAKKAKELDKILNITIPAISTRARQTERIADNAKKYGLEEWETRRLYNATNDLAEAIRELTLILGGNGIRVERP